jgi:hypothetical protein
MGTLSKRLDRLVKGVSIEFNDVKSEALLAEELQSDGDEVCAPEKKRKSIIQRLKKGLPKKRNKIGSSLLDLLPTERERFETTL